MSTDEFTWPSRIQKINKANGQEWAAEIMLSHSSHNSREHTFTFSLDTGGSLRLTLTNKDAAEIADRLTRALERDWTAIDEISRKIQQAINPKD